MASFMAAGYGMFSKKLGVCFGTGGKGALNETSGISGTPDSQTMFAATSEKAMRKVSSFRIINCFAEVLYYCPIDIGRTQVRRKNFARASSKTSKRKPNRCSWSATVAFAPRPKTFWKN